MILRSTDTPRIVRERWTRRGALGCVALSLVVAGCGGGEPAQRSDIRQAGEAVAPKAAAPRTTGRPRLVVLGDSLTAGLGLDPSQAYPALLQQRIDASSLEYEVVNAGVSGDTTAGALRRLDWALEGDVRVLVVALGGNDGLRGLPVDEMKRNLTAIVEQARRRGADVILAGMEAPPNFGAPYTADFRRVFSDLAKEHHLVLMPFLLDGVAGMPLLNQADGIHPTAEGARLIAEHVWPILEPVLERASRRGPAAGATRS